jgi:hypothetical protein
MMSAVNIIVIIAGLLIGLWCYGRQAISWLFIIIHMSAFSSKASFYELYDRADDETSFRWYKDHNGSIVKYADYLKLHADARPSAYGLFKSTYSALKRSLFFRIIPISLLPAIIFWTYWYFYLIGVGATLTILISYEIAKHGIRPGFYQRLAVYAILNTYAKKQSTADQ